MLQTRVMFARLGKNGAKLFFSLAVGAGVDGEGKPQYGLIIRDLVLRESNNGKGDYAAFPSKPRVKKTGAGTPITYEQQYVEGKAQYDQIVDLYYEGSGDQRKVTEFSWAVRKQIIEQAIEAYNKLASSEGGRGGAAAATAAP